jgi:hypothetical protein
MCAAIDQSGSGLLPVEHPRRNPTHRCSCGDVLRDDRSGSDGGALSNGHPGKNGTSGAQPHVRAHGDRVGVEPHRLQGDVVVVICIPDHHHLGQLCALPYRDALASNNDAMWPDVVSINHNCCPCASSDRYAWADKAITYSNCSPRCCRNGNSAGEENPAFEDEVWILGAEGGFAHLASDQLSGSGHAPKRLGGA